MLERVNTRAYERARDGGASEGGAACAQSAGLPSCFLIEVLSGVRADASSREIHELSQKKFYGLQC